MAGPIQSALSSAITTASAGVVAGKKMYEDAKQASEKASAEAEAENKAKETYLVKVGKEEHYKLQEAKESALEADLIRMGADEESARAFMDARALGLNTKQFGMIRKKGKFVGSYSSLAEKLSKDSLTDSLSSRVLNQKGFAERVVALGGSRKERVRSLVSASKGGKK